MNERRFSLFLGKSMYLKSWAKYLEQIKKIKQKWIEAETLITNSA